MSLQLLKHLAAFEILQIICEPFILNSEQPEESRLASTLITYNADDTLSCDHVVDQDTVFADILASPDPVVKSDRGADIEPLMVVICRTGHFLILSIDMDMTGYLHSCDTDECLPFLKTVCPVYANTNQTALEMK